MDSVFERTKEMNIKIDMPEITKLAIASFSALTFIGGLCLGDFIGKQEQKAEDYRREKRQKKNES